MTRWTTLKTVIASIFCLSAAVSADVGRLSLPREAALTRIDTLGAMIARHPDSADDWTELAWLSYRYAQDSDGALRAAERACGLNPSSFKAHELAGRLNFLRGHSDLALEHWLALLDEDRPEVQLYLTAVIGLATSQSEVDRVIARLRTLAGTHPSEVCRTIARRALADHDLGLGNVDATERAFGEVGTIDEWMIIGPFANERNAGFGTAFGPESEIDYGESYEGRDRLVSWRPLEHLTLRRYVDFAAVTYPREQVLAYALTFIHAKENADITLRLGAREAVKVWFNDRLVHAGELERGFVPDQTTIPLTIEKGYNKLLIKVGVETGAWRLSARLTDPSGRPLKNIDCGRERHDTPDRSDAAPPTFPYAAAMMEHFERVVQFDPQNEDALYYLGLAQNLNRFSAQASKTFERLCRLNDRCSDHHRLLARAYMGDDKAEKALEQMKLGLEVDPRNLQLRLMLARFYNGAGLHRQEREVLEDIDQRCPDWRDAGFQWVNYYAGRGWEELAFRKAKTLHETMPTDLRAAVTYAQMCSARGYADEFEQLVEHILSLDFTSRFARSEALAGAIAERRYNDAVAVYGMMQRVDPLNIELRLERARFLTSLKRYDEAIEQCHQALRICPADHAVHRELGTIHQRMGNDETALAAFRESLAFRPDDRWLREYVEYLEPQENLAFERYAISDAEFASLLQREVSRATHPRSDSVLILDEMITQLFDDGSSTYRIHQTIKVLDDAGRRQWTQVALPNGANRVERAAVIRPDGTEIEATSISDAQIQFSQLQPGATIDYIVTGYAPANDWMSREYSETFFFQTSDPMLDSRFVLLAPQSKPVNHWYRGDDVVYRTETFDNHTVHIWNARDIPRITGEPNSPPMVDVAAQVRVSSIRSWEDIARWEHSLIKEQFQPDLDLIARVHALTDGLQSTSEKIRAIANFVSQGIQYKIVRGGIFGYKPNKAANVLHNQWGDCKDKATLLITMLAASDIEARYATIRTRDAGRLIDEIPSNQCNHAIVLIPKTGDMARDLWVDGTALEYGISALPWADQDVVAMVWKSDGDMALTRTPLEPASNTVSEVSLNVTLHPDGAGEVNGKWVTTGQVAASIRNAFKQPGQRAERLTQWLNSFAPGSTLSDFDFSALEDRDAPVDIRMSFRTENYAADNGRELTIQLKRPTEATARFAPRDVRHHDVWMQFRQIHRLKEEILIPDRMRVASTLPDINLTTPWMSYKATVRRDGRTLRVSRELIFDTVTVPRNRYDELRRFCIAVDEYEAQTIVLRSEEP